MAESIKIICPNCGAKNTPDNSYCEDCGYNMKNASEHAAALFCPNGHSVSESGLRKGFCDVCGEKLVTEKPGKKCSVCGAINPESCEYCENCGHPLDEECETPPDPEERIVMPPSHTPKDPLPDIPDIMRTLTNDDMKR